MNIFYSKNTLNDNLVGYAQDNLAKSEEKKENLLILKDADGNVIGFNLQDISKQIQLPEGRIYPTPEIIELISKSIPNLKINLNEVFTVGEIKTCEDIEGTHLHKCTVDVGDEVLDIVCGAKNARQGIKVVVARVGVVMPSGLYIKPSKLKGFPSNGMLCSQKELNLQGFNEEGIIELDAKYQVGSKFKEMYSNL